MDAAATRCTISAVQKAFNVISILHLTSYALPDNDNDNDFPKFDFVVVGGGTAGSVVAARLAEDKKTQVLLIEAGGDPPVESSIPSILVYLTNSSVDWGYKAIDKSTTKGCKRSRNVGLALGRMLGGSTGTNYMLYGEGNRRQYNKWAKIVNDSSWDAEHLLPYFKKTQNIQNTKILNSCEEDFFGYDGPFKVTIENRFPVQEYLKAQKELGNMVVPAFTLNKTIGYSPAMYSIGCGLRQDTAYAYLTPIKDYPNLYVLKHALVTKILFDSHKNAIAVNVLIKNKIRTIRASKEIIISAGTVNTPKLLMLSGIGPKKHLKKKGVDLVYDLPVGRKLQSLSSTTIIFNMKNTNIMDTDKNPKEFPAVSYIGYVALNKSQCYADYQSLSFINYASDQIRYCTQIYEFPDRICNKFFGPYCNVKGYDENQMVFNLVTDLHPKSRGKVLLRSNHYKDPPLVYVRYLTEESEVDNMVKYIKDYLKVLDTKTFKSLGAELVDPEIECCKDLKLGSDKYWKCYVKCLSAIRHYDCGTCAMGSVVNKRLKVYGVKRLRVVDASVVPVIPDGVLTSAVLVIAEKAADMIKEDHNL